MTQAFVIGLALLIGIVAGLRAMTAPAVVAWGAHLGWLDTSDRWSHWVGSWITVAVLTVFLVVELVTDQLPKTPSRTTPPQFVTRMVTGAFAGAVIGSAWHHTFIAIGGGIIGAVLGTLGGHAARRRLVAANGGRDLPIALLEDAIAVLGGFGIVALASTLPPFTG
ncbi:membrane protein [Mycolicibacterium madagascariense]|jgi:uncharacterized membrane protein|uniref:Membrane protein n=1 Tax=Mycolicibacterium madagascariense TaxID=212765 RepID=A0A7I7XIP6_9MYCO|nr:DUF4126 family protein [Mycolicibacterium madagascariense]MCV7011025.1 DUF4126 family protein [Mycolicibacterium madagascariense]BBZ29077.1 membrane protein [Mycolicibacterium madagascariense]